MSAWYAMADALRNDPELLGQDGSDLFKPFQHRDRIYTSESMSDSGV